MLNVKDRSRFLPAFIHEYKSNGLAIHTKPGEANMNHNIPLNNNMAPSPKDPSPFPVSKQGQAKEITNNPILMYLITFTGAVVEGIGLSCWLTKLKYFWFVCYGAIS